MAIPLELQADKTALDEILGPIYLEALWYNMGPTVIPWPIDSFFFGVLLCQVISYYTSAGFKTDRLYIKLTVAGCVAMAIATTILSWRWSCSAILTYSGQYWPYTASEFGTPFYPIMGLGALMFNGFYCHRAWLLYDRNWAVPVVIMSLSLATFVGSVGISYAFFQKTLEIESNTVLAKVFAYMYIYPAGVCDLCLTLLLMNALVRRRNGWSNTDFILKKLLFLTFETQVPPTVFALVVAIHFSFGFSLILALPYVQISGKIYACSLLHTLNSRGDLALGMPDVNVHESFKMGPTKNTNTVIDVKVETFVDTELGYHPDSPDSRRKQQRFSDDDEVDRIEEGSSVNLVPSYLA